MSIRTIIMPFATLENAQERMQGALNVAKYFQAHLEVLHSQVGSNQLLPEEIRLLSSKLYSRIDQLVSNYIEESMVESKVEFEQVCNKLGVTTGEGNGNEASATWLDMFGYRAETVAERGKVSDLIIIPKSIDGKNSVSFQAAIDHGCNPVLIMPRTQTEFSPKTIVIAWNGDDAGARAVSAAIPVLQKADRVVIVTSERSLLKKPTQQDLQVFLKRHLIDSECVSFSTSRLNTPRNILKVALDQEADLIVAGALVHQKLHKQMFGGVTQKLLRYTHIPLFMMA